MASKPVLDHSKLLAALNASAAKGSISVEELRPAQELETGTPAAAPTSPTAQAPQVKTAGLTSTPPAQASNPQEVPASVTRRPGSSVPQPKPKG